MNRIKVASMSGSVRKAGMLLTLLGGLVVCAQAQLLIDVGDRDVLPSTTQTIELTVQNTGGSAISFSGLNFNIEVPSGAPAITGVDLITGTLFSSNNDGQLSGTESSTYWGVSVTTAGSPPTSVTLGAGLTAKLATVTFSTGAIGGPWTLAIKDTIGDDTEFLNSVGGLISETVTINNGTISVVPEPNATLAVAGLLLGVAAVARRWRAAR